MTKTKLNLTKSLITRAICTASAIAMCFGLASCSANSESSNGAASSEANAAGMSVLSGVKASGALGKQPKVELTAPINVKPNSYAILQEGNGAKIPENSRVCANGIVYNAKSGKELMNTWKQGKPDCSIVVKKGVTSKSYYTLLKGRKINSTIAFGIPANPQTKQDAYVMVLTLVSAMKTLDRATGNKVKDIPQNLPKVTLDKSGAPSLDKNNYVPNGKLISQTLIEGNGKVVTEKSTVTAHYTGWTTDKDGKLYQFDSSWKRGTPADFSLAGQVIPGWTKGLAGKKVGSQVLLVIPPEDGYGKEDKKDAKGNVTIPANSTLYFVVDILYAS